MLEDFFRSLTFNAYAKKTPPEKITGAIFDLDGTLLDTMTQWNSLGVDFLRENGIEPTDGFLDKLSTMTLRESAAFFQREYGLNLTVEDILNAMRERLRRLYTDDARIKPGALDTLRFLRRAGVELAVATATSTDLATAGLARVGALEFFHGIFSCRDPNIKTSKDSPKIYETARKFLGSQKSETIVVEDALYAIETAKRAGFFVIGIEDESERARKEKIQKIADLYVSSHTELTEWLKTRFANA